VTKKHSIFQNNHYTHEELVVLVDNQYNAHCCNKHNKVCYSQLCTLLFHSCFELCIIRHIFLRLRSHKSCLLDNSNRTVCLACIQCIDLFQDNLHIHCDNFNIFLYLRMFPLSNSAHILIHHRLIQMVLCTF